MPGSAYKGADFGHVLLAWSALYPGGDIHAARLREAQGLADVLGIQSAGQHERNTRIDILQQPPVERSSKPAGARRLARGPGVEQQAVGDFGVVGHEPKV